MSLLHVFRRFDRWLGRFNDRFGETAVASHAESNGALSAQVDPAAAAAIVREIEKQGASTEDADPAP